MKKIKVLLIFGGRSAEHEISLLSARNVAAALDRQRFELHLVGISRQGTWYLVQDENSLQALPSLSDDSVPAGYAPCALVNRSGHGEILDIQKQIFTRVDVAFPIMHGSYGEDGSIQGLFRMMNLPFVGCGLFACSAGIDKEIMKRILHQAEIPCAKYLCLHRSEKHSFDFLVQKLGLPFFIKPASQGSSVGVHKVKSEADFKTQLADAFLYDTKVLAEEFIEGREIECAVLGLNSSPKASLCGEVIPQHEFYSYEAKYLDENGAKLAIPAELSPAISDEIRALAQKTFRAMGCEGLTRVDFFLQKNGRALVNEINTMPGFTKISMYPKMWQATGLEYTPLISELIDLGLASFAIQDSLKTQFPGAKGN